MMNFDTMRVSTALIVVNIIFCLIQSSMGRIPKDKEPINVYKLEDSSWLQVFRGSKETGQSAKTLPMLKNFQGMTSIDGYHYIYARDNIFVVDLKSQSSGTGEVTYKQVMTWKSDDASIQLCQAKGQTNKKCQNFIKIFQQVHGGESPNQRVIVCSTKSFSPTCRYYELTKGGNLSYLNQEFGGTLSCPFDPDYDVASIVSGDNLYTATQASFRGDDPLIHRSSVVRNVHSRRWDTSLRTASGEATFLNGPHFVKFVDGGMSLNKVFSFFTEISVEDKSEQVYTRIGQVCKNDGGGRNLRNQFSSFFKARLNCSLPGQPPFYFNEMSDVTELVTLDKWYKVGKTKMVFALMSTPSNSIPASAICAFSLPDIEASMNGAFYEKFTDAKTSSQYWAQQDHYPDPHVASCASDPRKLSDHSLNFVRKHPIMYQSVNAWDLHGNVTQPHNAIPLYSRTNSGNFLTALVVDTTAGTTPIYTVFIAGTDDGRIVKVLLGAGTESVLIEERSVYSEDGCGPGNKRVLSINLDKPTGSMLVAFENCVIRAPLCALNTSCGRSCIKSRDPYCGWDGKNCVVVDSQYHANSTSGAQPRQDVLEGNVAGMEECKFHDTDLGAPSIGAPLPSSKNEEVEPAANDTSHNVTVAPVLVHDVSGATTSKFTTWIVLLLVAFVVGVVIGVGLCALHRRYCGGKLSKKDDVILTTLPNGNDVRRSSNQSNGRNVSKSRQPSTSSHARNRTSTHEESRRTRRITETSAVSGAEEETFLPNDLALTPTDPPYDDVTDRRSKQLRSTSSSMGGRCKARNSKPSTSSSPENPDDLQHSPQKRHPPVPIGEGPPGYTETVMGVEEGQYVRQGSDSGHSSEGIIIPPDTDVITTSAPTPSKAGRSAPSRSMSFQGYNPNIPRAYSMDNQGANTVGHSRPGARGLMRQHSLQVADTMPGRYHQQHPLYVSMPPPVQNPSNPIPAGWPNPPQPNPTPGKAFDGRRVPMGTHSLDRRKMIKGQPQYQVPQNEVFEESAPQQMMGPPNGLAGRKRYMSESEKNRVPVMSRPTPYHQPPLTIHEEQEPTSHGEVHMRDPKTIRNKLHLNLPQAYEEPRNGFTTHSAPVQMPPHGDLNTPSHRRGQYPRHVIPHSNPGTPMRGEMPPGFDPMMIPNKGHTTLPSKPKQIYIPHHHSVPEDGITRLRPESGGSPTKSNPSTPMHDGRPPSFPSSDRRRNYSGQGMQVPPSPARTTAPTSFDSPTFVIPTTQDRIRHISGGNHPRNLTGVQHSPDSQPLFSQPA
ncbi:unnamed protein product [Clavelina lepadiformis]|uniref:Sema domain-containing protein n=1 Tax=Clavelina lepadiformis TaxID=159417 RepID=A0ABP0GQ32_CLALP